MFKIWIRNLDTETYEVLSCPLYQTREEAEEAIKHMWVQVRRGGKYIVPEEFKITEELARRVNHTG